MYTTFKTFIGGELRDYPGCHLITEIEVGVPGDITVVRKPERTGMLHNTFCRAAVINSLISVAKSPMKKDSRAMKRPTTSCKKNWQSRGIDAVGLAPRYSAKQNLSLCESET